MANDFAKLGFVPEEEFEKLGFQPETQAPAAEVPQDFKALGFTPAEDFNKLGFQPEEEDDQPSQLESLARGAAQGLSMGFSDEAVGVAESLFSDKTYEQARDESRAANKAAQEAHPYLFTAGNVAGGVGLALVPGLNFAGYFGGGVRGAALAGGVEGALSGAGYSDEKLPEDLAKDVVSGMVLGAGAGAALAGSFKAIGAMRGTSQAKTVAAAEASEAIRNGRAPADDVTQMVVDSLSEGDTSLRIQERFLRKMDEIGEEGLKLPKDADKRFVAWKLGRPIGSKVGKAEQRQFMRVMDQYDDKTKQAIYENYIKQEKMLEAVDEVRELEARDIVGIDDPFEKKRLLSFLGAGSHVAQAIDDKAGTNLLGMVYKFSDAERKVSRVAEPLLKKARPILEETKKVFKDGASRERLYRWLDGADVKMSAEELKVANQWQKVYREAFKTMKAEGLNVGDRGFRYQFHTKASAPDIKIRLENRYSELRKRGIDLNSGHPKAVEFRAALKNMLGEELTSPKDIRKFLANMLEPEVLKSKTGFEASSAFSREDALPDILLEKDPTKLFARYLNTNLKGLYYRDAFEELHTNIAALRGLGMEKSAQLWEDYARSMSGQPSTAMAYLQAKADKIRYAGKKLAEDGHTKLGAAVEAFPDFLSWSTAQIYPNYLGWNVAAPLRNMTQTWLVTAPEIGGTYGYDVTRKGWARAVKGMAKGEGMKKFLQDRGYEGGEFVGEAALDAVERGIHSSGNAALRGIDQVGKMGMKLYGLSDMANRYASYHIGQQLAEDVIAGNAKALPYLKRLPAGVKGEVRHYLTTGQTDKVKDIITKHLVESTQFQYTRADLSKFGRDFGRLFTMFTKWPTMIAGDMERIIRTQKDTQAVGRLMAKYVAPLSALAIAQAGLDEMEVTDNPTYRALIGRSLTTAAPINSIQVGLPPLIKEPTKFAAGILKAFEGEWELAGQLTGGALQPFIPGGFVPVGIQRVNNILED